MGVRERSVDDGRGASAGRSCQVLRCCCSASAPACLVSAPLLTPASRLLLLLLLHHQFTLFESPLFFLVFQLPTASTAPLYHTATASLLQPAHTRSFSFDSSQFASFGPLPDPNNLPRPHYATHQTEPHRLDIYPEIPSSALDIIQTSTSTLRCQPRTRHIAASRRNIRPSTSLRDTTHSRTCRPALVLIGPATTLY